VQALVGVVRAGAWVASGAVGVDEAGDRPPAAVVGDGPVLTASLREDERVTVS
jgi:hypothetical protein